MYRAPQKDCVIWPMAQDELPGLVVLLALGERLAEIGVGAEVERRLVLLVLEREVGPVGS